MTLASLITNEVALDIICDFCSDFGFEYHHPIIKEDWDCYTEQNYFLQLGKIRLDWDGFSLFWEDPNNGDLFEVLDSRYDLN